MEFNIEDEIDEKEEKIVRIMREGGGLRVMMKGEEWIEEEKKEEIGEVEERKMGLIEILRKRVRIKWEKVINREDLKIEGSIIIKRVVWKVMEMMNILSE